MSWFALPLILEGVKYAVTQVALWAAFLSLKPYIIWILIAFAISIGAKGVYYIMLTLMQILKSTVGKYLIGGLLILLTGGVLGWMAHPDSDKINVKKIRLTEERIRSKDGAVIVKGKTYYKAAVINEYLKQQGLVKRFAPVID